MREIMQPVREFYEEVSAMTAGNNGVSRSPDKGAVRFARAAIWSAILLATLVFWSVVGMSLLAWMRSE